MGFDMVRDGQRLLEMVREGEGGLERRVIRECELELEARTGQRTGFGWLETVRDGQRRFERAFKMVREGVRDGQRGSGQGQRWSQRWLDMVRDGQRWLEKVREGVEDGQRRGSRGLERAKEGLEMELETVRNGQKLFSHWFFNAFYSNVKKTFFFAHLLPPRPPPHAR